MVKCSLTEFGRARPDNKHWDDLRAKSLPVRPSHPVDKYILRNFFLFRSYAVRQNTNHSQPKTGCARSKKLIRTLVTFRFTFQQKIAHILLCLNSDDERRYMHSIKSN